MKIAQSGKWGRKACQGTEGKLTKPGYRMYIDITSSKYVSAGGSKYWFLAATRMKFSMFLKQKSEVKESFVPFLKELRHTHGIKIEHIRCDNAGKNRVLEDLCIAKRFRYYF